MYSLKASPIHILVSVCSLCNIKRPRELKVNLTYSCNLNPYIYLNFRNPNPMDNGNSNAIGYTMTYQRDV